ncbi:HNH endonuclease, partial [Corynebacterium pseudodiphtheriticum]|nr:HNH endonuclease [Corynebacterium pseudodiphtheriticum]
MNADATAYFTHCNPHDEDAQTMLDLRRQEFHAWDSLIDFEHYDYDLLLKELMETTGLSSHKVGDIIGAFYRMTDLPKLRDLATTMWHIDIDRWIAIDRAMVKAGDVNAHLFAVIDNLLVEYLTPTKPAQQMPSRRSIINRINREIEAHDSSVRQKQKKNPTRKNYEVHDIPLSSRNDNDTHEFHFDTDAATAVKIDAHVHEHAKTAGISLRDATIDLLLGKAHTSVTLNCYRAN